MFFTSFGYSQRQKSDDRKAESRREWLLLENAAWCSQSQTSPPTLDKPEPPWQLFHRGPTVLVATSRHVSSVRLAGLTISIFVNPGVAIDVRGRRYQNHVGIASCTWSCSTWCGSIVRLPRKICYVELSLQRSLSFTTVNKINFSST